MIFSSEAIKSVETTFYGAHVWQMRASPIYDRQIVDNLISRH